MTQSGNGPTRKNIGTREGATSRKMMTKSPAGYPHGPAMRPPRRGGRRRPFRKQYVLMLAILLVLAAFAMAEVNHGLQDEGAWTTEQQGDATYTETGTEQNGADSQDSGTTADNQSKGNGENAVDAGHAADSQSEAVTVGENSEQTAKITEITLADIPEYSGEAYAVLNDNVPLFTASELAVTESFEEYSELDALGRCGVAYANVGTDIMPTESRGSIGQVKPTGWHTAKYDSVNGEYLYNRCHLIAFELAGENANEKNLITGTRYMNVTGMLPFENMVHDYVKETGNHVLYRVTPMFEGDDLVARGVLMEGYSVEDSGEGICFCIFAYNVQPGIIIDYATGESESE